MASHSKNSSRAARSERHNVVPVVAVAVAVVVAVAVAIAAAVATGCTFNCATTTKRNAQNTNLDAVRNPKHTSEQ